MRLNVPLGVHVAWFRTAGIYHRDRSEIAESINLLLGILRSDAINDGNSNEISKSSKLL
jgi:hypothetical protein